MTKIKVMYYQKELCQKELNDKDLEKYRKECDKRGYEIVVLKDTKSKN